jgi:putative adhesin
MKYFNIFRVPLLMVTLIGSASGLTAGTRARSDKHQVPRPFVERAVAADRNVAVSVCLVSGDIKVHGWDRNEVRARSNDVHAIEFRRAIGARESDPAREITVLLSDMRPQRSGPCSADADIELDVPRGAIVRLQTRDGNIQVVDVSVVTANAQSGDLDLQGIKRSVEAGTIGGDISLRNSNGPINLHSVGGSIEAHGVGPAAAGDVFEASTVGGDITLEKIGSVKVKAKTVGGSLSLSGALAGGARYEFKTLSGDINFALPSDSSFRLDATLSQGGELVTEFPLRVITESKGPSSQYSVRSAPPAKSDLMIDPDVLIKGSDHGVQRISGVYGTGDALITASSFSGAINLRKK